MRHPKDSDPVPATGTSIPPPKRRGAVLTKSSGMSAKAVASILEKSSPFRRFTHDTGFHKERITALATAFNGTHLVTGSPDGTVRLWDASSAACIRVFSNRGSTLTGILTAPTRNRMILMSLFRGKTLWDLITGKRLADLSEHPGTPVHCNDTHFFCRQDWDVTPLIGKRRPRSHKSEVLVHEIETGTRFRRFEIEDSRIASLAVSPDGEIIAVVDADHFLRIWDIRSGECIHRSHNLNFQKIIGISPDSRYLVLKSAGLIDVRDRVGMRTVFTMGVPSGNHHPRYVLRGFRLIEKTLESVLLKWTSKLRIIDIRAAAILRTDTYRGDIELRSIMGNEEFCLGFDQGRVDVWDMPNHRVLASLALDPVYPAWKETFHAALIENRRLALSREESVVRILDPAQGRFANVIPSCEPVRDVRIAPDGKGLLAMSASAAKYWDLAGGRFLGEFPVPSMEFEADLPPDAPLTAFTPDGKRLLLPSEKGIALWDLSTGGKISDFSITGNAGSAGTNAPGPFALYATADGKRVMVVSGLLGFLGAYDLRTGAAASGFPMNDIGRFDAFCMGGDVFAVSQGDIMTIRDAETGRRLRDCDQGSFIYDIAFLPSRGEMVTTNSHRLYFWDGVSGKLLKTEPPGSSLIGISLNTFGRWFFPVPGDGKFLVPDNSCIALWDMDARRFAWRDDSHRKNRVRKAVPFPDGKRFIMLDVTGTVEVRSMENGAVLATLRIWPDGFVWETPPDSHAPSGWLWTDREDRVAVMADAGPGRDAKIFRKGDAEHTACLKITNNRAMVAARIKGEDAYKRQAALYARVLGDNQIRSKSGLPPARLPASLPGVKKRGRP